MSSIMMDEVTSQRVLGQATKILVGCELLFVPKNIFAGLEVYDGRLGMFYPYFFQQELQKYRGDSQL